MAQRTNFINETGIYRQIEKGKNRSPEDIRAILQKASEGKGIDPPEAAALLQVENPSLIGEMFQTARGVKERIYGKRLVLFAPLYLSNHCVNNCLYCGFRRDNREITRRRLTPAEIRNQVEELESLGHKRLLLECGESPLADMGFVEEAIVRPTRPFTRGLRGIMIVSFSPTTGRWKRG
jgi:2-iminoacetate synthase